MLANSLQPVAHDLPSALLPLRETNHVAPVGFDGAPVGAVLPVGAAVVDVGVVGAVVGADVVLGAVVGADVVVGALLGADGEAASANVKSSMVRVPTDCRLKPKLSRAASLGTAAVLYLACVHVEVAGTVEPLNQYTHLPVLLLRYQPTHCTFPVVLYQPPREYW
jgi:hypothetical protein